MFYERGGGEEREREKRETAVLFLGPPWAAGFGSSTSMSSETLTSLCKPTFIQNAIKYYDA